MLLACTETTPGVIRETRETWEAHGAYPGENRNGCPKLGASQNVLIALRDRAE